MCCEKLPCRLNLVVLVLLSAAILQDTLPWLHEPLFQAFVALVAFAASAAATVAGSSLELALRSHLRLHLHRRAHLHPRIDRHLNLRLHWQWVAVIILEVGL